jgi:SAM-dependent methyltransferase
MQEPLSSEDSNEELYTEEFYDGGGVTISLDHQNQLMRGLIMDRVRILTELNGRPGSLLDVGAGTGLFVDASIRGGWQAIGIETSAAAVRIADRIAAGAVRHARLEDWQSETKFDAVTLWDVLEHVPDPRFTLQKIRNLLHRGGLVGISLPSVASLKARMLGKRWRYFRREFGHVSHFSPQTLTTLLHQTDFVPVLVKTSGAFNLGKPFGLKPPQVRESHGTLTRLQHIADAATGCFGLGEDLMVIGRRADS